MFPDKLSRYAFIVRVGGVLIVVAILGFVLFQVYDFYNDKVGYTAPKALRVYLDALATGNTEEVYRMTAKDRLVDIYGRPVTEAEFYRQLERLTGGRDLPFTVGEVTKLAERGTAHFYQVTLVSTIGDSPGESRLLLELRRRNRTWVVTYPFAIVL